MKISNFIFISTLLISGAFAADDPRTLGELCTRMNSLTVQQIPIKLAEYASKDPQTMKKLCEEIKAPTFYEFAQQAGIGTIKNRAMMSFASGVVFERANLTLTFQMI